MTEVKFDWESGIEEVCLKLQGKKRIGIQVPEGLKPRAHQIVERVRELTGAKIVLWGEPTYGACDLADRPLEEIGADALIHMGHLPMPYHSEFYAVPTYFVPVRHTGELNLNENGISKIKEILPRLSRNYVLKMTDPKHTQIPVSRAQTKRLRDYLKL